LKVVQGIQKVRDTHLASETRSPELVAIDTALKNSLDKKDRWMIAQAKQKLSML